MARLWTAYQKVITVAGHVEFLLSRMTDMVLSDELNEEDAQLKSELEMLVERLQVSLKPGHWLSTKY